MKLCHSINPRERRFGHADQGGRDQGASLRTTVTISITISLIICLSPPSGRLRLPGANAQLAPSQPTRQPPPPPPAAAPVNLIKIRQQQPWHFRYPRESANVAAHPASGGHDASKQNVTKQNRQTAPTFKPPPLIETTTTLAPRFGLIARTSDAIYKTLAGYFSHEDQERRADERPMFGLKITTTTTSSPVTTTPRMTTKWPETTTTTTTNSRRTTLSGGRGSGGGGVLPLATTTTTIIKPPDRPARATTRTPTTLANVRSTPPAWVSQTTSAPRSKLTTVPHYDLGTYTDQIESMASTATTTIKTSATTTTSKPQTTTTTSLPPPPHFTIAKPQTKPSLEPASSTQQPRPFSQTGNLTAFTPTQAQPPSTGAVSQRAEFFSFLSQAIKSIYSLNEFAYSSSSSSNRNRSTRLAPPHTGEHESEHESGETASMASAPSDKLVQANDSQTQQVVSASTRDGVLFLCKLLHQRLESSRKNENGSITLTLDAPFWALAANLSSPAPSTPSPSPDATSPGPRPAAPPRGEFRPPEAPPQESLSAGARLIGDPQRELSELQHEDRLLESTFALEDSRRQGANRSHEQVAEELLGNLYNLGHRRKQMIKTSEHARPASNETHDDEYSGSSYQPEVDSHPLAGNISLRVWSRTTTGGNGGGGGGTGGGRLKLVYWLLERVRVPAGQQTRTGGAGNLRLSSSSSSSSIRYKVLDLQEAGELLDQLDHAYVQQLIDALALVRPIVLVAAHKRAAVADDLGNQVAPPLVLDDSLTTYSPGGASGGGGGGGELTQNNNNRTTLHLLVDKLTQASFSDNLYLYSILFLLALFLLIMCFAVPALCCKCMMPASVARMRPGGRRAADRRLPVGGRRNRQRAGDEFQPASYNDRTPSPSAGTKSHSKSRDPLRASISSISAALGATNGGGGGKHLNEGAIWRKLSNSTTTLTRDQMRSLEDDGQVNVAVISGDHNRQQSPGRQNSTNNNNKFEWYTFEDNQTLRKTTSSSADSQDRPSQTLVVRDQRKVTKSIQTYQAPGSSRATAEPPPPVSSPTSGASGPFSDSIDREHLSMAYRDRLETRNSDTLTKSELVMLKEKLIPIGRELRVKQQQQERDQQVEINKHDYVNTGQQRSDARQVARHIDSTSVESGPGTGSDGGRNRYMAHAVPALADESQRAPSMRYLELPAGAQTRASGPGGAELGSRDPHGRNAPVGLRVPAGTNNSTSDQLNRKLADGTYKRYDVI